MIYIELTHPMGRVDVMPLDVYVALPPDALRGTRARLMTRVEVVRLRAAAR